MLVGNDTVMEDLPMNIDNPKEKLIRPLQADDVNDGENVKAKKAKKAYRRLHTDRDGESTMEKEPEDSHKTKVPSDLSTGHCREVMMAQERTKVILGHLRQRDQRTFISSPVSTTGQGIESLGSDFQFTLNNSRLTPAQRSFYEENGFLVIPNLVQHHLIDRWKARFLDLVEGRDKAIGLTKMKDIALKDVKGVSGELIVNKIQGFEWDEVLSEHCMLPQILDYVECFTGPNIRAMHTMLINKPPDPGTRTSRHPLHQDLHYFPFRPANRIVCAWTAMEKINEDNGCLFVVPGSHKGRLEQHDYPEWEDGVNKMYHGVRGFDDEPKAMLHMEKGDTVYFHPLLLHGSGDNRTKHFRKAISCHYASSNCHYIDVSGTTQENIAKEVEGQAIRKGLQGLDFQGLWKFRSRLVRGVDVSL